MFLGTATAVLDDRKASSRMRAPGIFGAMPVSDSRLSAIASHLPASIAASCSSGPDSSSWVAFGEAAKDLHYGEALARLRELAAQTEFEYRLSGDLDLSGRARSILIANTPSIGALIPVGKKTPEEPSLELNVKGDRHRVRRVRIETDPPVSVHADTADLGSTPVEVETMAGGLQVILPS